MTYLRDDQDKEEGQVQSNVLGGQQAPLEQETPQQEGAIQPQQASTMGTSGGTRPTAAGTSGQFTDVKKYVEKNKPQAAKMTEAASKNITDQSSQIAKNTAARKSALGSVIDANKAQIASDQQSAMQYIDQAGTSQAAPTAEQTQSFQDIYSGQKKYTPIEAQNTSAQEAEARRMGNMDTSVDATLQRTFGDQGRQYTSGQQGLDSMLMSGTGASGQLRDLASAESKARLAGIQNYKNDVSAGIAAQNLGIKEGFKDAEGNIISTGTEGLTEAAREAVSGINTDLEARVLARQEQLAGLSGAAQSKFDTALEASRSGDLNEQNIKDLYSSLSEYGVDPSKMQEYIDLIPKEVTLASAAKEYGTMRQFGGLADSNRGIALANEARDAEMQGVMDNIYSDVGGSREDALNNLLASKYGIEDSSSYFDKAGIASEADLRRMQALQGITGGEAADWTLNDVGSQNTFLEELKADLNRRDRTTGTDDGRVLPPNLR